MPKSKYKRVGQRGEVQVNDGTGSSGVPAAIRAHSDGGAGGRYVAPSGGSALSVFSSVLGELASQAKQAENRAYEEAKYQQRRAEAEADRQRLRAEMRAEAQADAAETAAAAKSFMGTKLDIINSVHTGDITSYDQLVARADEILNSAAATPNAAASQYLTKATTSMLDEVGRDLLNRNERKRQRGLQASAGSLLMSVVDANANLSDDDAMASIDAGMNSYLESGGTREEYYHNAIAVLSNAALQKAGTSDGEALYDRLERLRASGRLSPQSPEQLQQYHAFQNAYAKASKEWSAKEDLLSRQEDSKRQAMIYNNISGEIFRQTDVQRVLQSRIHFESLEGFQNLKDAVGDELAQKLLSKVRQHEEYLEKKDQPDWQELERQSQQAASEWIARMERGTQLPTDEQFDADARLLQKHVNTLAEKRDLIRQAADEGVFKLVEEALTTLERKLPLNAAWRGGWDDTVAGPRMIPEVRLRAKAMLQESAVKEHLAINPQNAEERAARTIKINEAIERASKELFDNGHNLNLHPEVRPVVTGEKAVVDLDKYPLQEGDIRRLLFSGKKDGVAAGYRVDGKPMIITFNRTEYERLPSQGKEVADNILYLETVAEYMRIHEKRMKAGDITKLWHYFTDRPGDPALQDNHANAPITWSKGRKFHIAPTLDVGDQVDKIK